MAVDFRTAARQVHNVLLMCVDGAWMTAGEIREATELDVQTTTRALRLLKDKNRIQHNGINGRGSAYRIETA